ncbi:MAG: hypothetical protein KAU07_02665 [Candidatus Andersenbacteria bacterium]|nr:hypothetical protein [Candidatus Andersenbacteria bacterium]
MTGNVGITVDESKVDAIAAVAKEIGITLKKEESPFLGPINQIDLWPISHNQKKLNDFFEKAYKIMQ